MTPSCPYLRSLFYSVRVVTIYGLYFIVSVSLFTVSILLMVRVRIYGLHFINVRVPIYGLYFIGIMSLYLTMMGKGWNPPSCPYFTDVIAIIKSDNVPILQ
jgi:hypothetical protein